MAPRTKVTRMDRAKKERMYFMGRAATSHESAAAFIVTGQSGKVWTVQIPRKGGSTSSSSRRASRFRCNCPDNLMRGGTCKHMLFVCLRVLRISEAELKGLEKGNEMDVSFLHEVLERVAPEVDERYCAPAALKERLKSIAGDFEADGVVPRVPERKPEPEDSCPICYENLLDGTPLVYCGYGCGKPVHVECFERYTKAHRQRLSKGEVGDEKLRCVTCRMDWEVQPRSAVGNQGMLVNRRAINLADAMPEQFIMDEPAANPTNTRASDSKSKRTNRVSKGRVTKSKSKASKSKASASKVKSTRKSTSKPKSTKSPSASKSTATKRKTTRVTSTKAEETMLEEAIVTPPRKSKRIAKQTPRKSLRIAKQSTPKTKSSKAPSTKLKKSTSSKTRKAPRRETPADGWWDGKDPALAESAAASRAERAAKRAAT